MTQVEKRRREQQSEAAQLRQEFWQAHSGAYVDRKTAAAARYVTSETLESEAIKGGGPPYIRVGRRALYKKDELLAWMERTGRKVENTAQLSQVSA